MNAKEQLYPTPVAVKKPILLEANDIINGDRAEKYGHPYEGYKRCIDMINALFSHKIQVPFEPQDWPLMMICFKLTREVYQQERDNMRDVAGYTGCHEKVIDAKMLDANVKHS